MKTIGAFEAKTHFAKLLRGVEQGETYEIHRRGKTVAKLTSVIARHGEEDVREMLDYFRGMRIRCCASVAEISGWKQKGRQ